MVSGARGQNGGGAGLGSGCRKKYGVEDCGWREKGGICGAERDGAEGELGSAQESLGALRGVGGTSDARTARRIQGTGRGSTRVRA